MIQPALLGGVFIGVLSALPVMAFGNCCCCLWVITGGMLAAYLDQDRPRPSAPGRGALDGLAAGIVGAFVWLFVSIAIDPLMGAVQRQIIERLLETATDMPPDVREFLETVSESSAGALRYVVGFMFQLMVGVFFATLGGFLGALFFWREDVPPAIGGPQPPPPLPPQF